MAGIYIHVPFCQSRCVYCGFYSTTLLDLRQRYVDALCNEYRQRLGYVQLPPTTIYLGGGTPSVLTTAQLEQLFATVGDAPEVTMECNPDDVTDSFAFSLRRLPVNRVSMGAQTFSDGLLRFLGRRHTANQVAQAVEHLRSAGIANISIDLIYGFPGETLHEWLSDVEAALALQVEHLSAYALTYEEGTPLWHMAQQGRVTPADEELMRSMYYAMADQLCASGYEHYEISNFARKGHRSRHNSAYWNHTPYLGLGAAAHSFDGHFRQWNVADVRQYIKGVENGCMEVESEVLDGDTLYNDLLMTALRTKEGLDLNLLSHDHRQYCTVQARRYTDGGLLVHDKATNHLRLTREGLFVSDMIMADLMIA